MRQRCRRVVARCGGGDDPSDEDVENAARSLDEVLAYCKAHNVKGFHHAHMRTLIETVEDAERLMTAAPDLWLLYDTGHMLAAGAAGSDPMQVFERDMLRNRIGHVHLKDVHANDPASWNHRTGQFNEEARFAELGAGNMGFDARAALEKLEEVGYDGWVSVELDRPYPPKPPAEAAKSKPRVSAKHRILRRVYTTLDNPPSRLIAVPVMKEAHSEARKATSVPASEGSPKRPSGCSSACSIQ